MGEKIIKVTTKERSCDDAVPATTLRPISGSPTWKTRSVYETMMINAYTFGQITIGGRQYTTDIIIYPEGCVEGNWRRQNGHRLLLDDIQKLIATDPDIIIVGTGAGGLMKPDANLTEQLTGLGIELIAQPSKNAVASYNKLAGQKKVGACFHLTC